jgi:acid stress-induced BolA-like protein IbaG/YrbA
MVGPMFSTMIRQGLRPIGRAHTLGRRYGPREASIPLLARSMGGDGQITNELVDRMRSKIRDALQAQRVEVADVQGDGRHVEIVVVSKEFEGKSAVNRQRMVYKVWVSYQPSSLFRLHLP